MITRIAVLVLGAAAADGWTAPRALIIPTADACLPPLAALDADEELVRRGEGAGLALCVPEVGREFVGAEGPDEPGFPGHAPRVQH